MIICGTSDGKTSVFSTIDNLYLNNLLYNRLYTIEIQINPEFDIIVREHVSQIWVPWDFDDESKPPIQMSSRDPK